MPRGTNPKEKLFVGGTFVMRGTNTPPGYKRTSKYVLCGIRDVASENSRPARRLNGFRGRRKNGNVRHAARPGNRWSRIEPLNFPPRSRRCLLGRSIFRRSGKSLPEKFSAKLNNTRYITARCNGVGAGERHYGE